MEHGRKSGPGFRPMRYAFSFAAICATCRPWKRAASSSFSARLALALAAGDRGRAIGRAADDLVQGHLALIGIGQADDHHAEMQQVGDAGEQGRLLAAMLRRRGGEHAADLAGQRARGPERARRRPRRPSSARPCGRTGSARRR